jgi:integrase
LDKPLDKRFPPCVFDGDFGHRTVSAVRRRTANMARTVEDSKLDSRAARAKLAVSGKPYYRQLHEGLHLGYRKGKVARQWVVRIYLEAGKYAVEKIGKADDTADANGADILTFRQAQKKANEKYDEHQTAAEALPEAKPYTVRDAIEDYLEFLKAERRTEADARSRAYALITPKLGGVVCDELSTDMLQKWLRDTAACAPRLRTRCGKEQLYREIDPDDAEAKRRRGSAANRVWTIFRAALNQGWRAGKIKADERIWKRVVAFQDVDAARPHWLNNDESRRFINACQGEFKTLVRAALHTGAAYGSLAALNVGDFAVHVVQGKDGPIEQGTVHIVRYKGKGGKVRHVNVQLTDEAIAFFRGITAGRPASAPMLTRPDGNRWGKSQQTRLMRAASKAARIDPPVGFHTLRHTWASQGVQNRMPLFVVAQNLGHADTRMVEKHYGHLGAILRRRAGAAIRTTIRPNARRCQNASGGTETHLTA